MSVPAAGLVINPRNRREVVAAALGGGLALSGYARPAAAASGVRTLISADQLRPAYDYAIIGAGSAGCVLAHRLARAGRRVLLIEAGGPADLPAIADPPDWPQLQGGSVDWRYRTVPQPGLGGRVVPYPRGKVVGGSSAINALAYQRGHPAAYDRWPAGWQYADLLPCFKRAETFSGGASQWRGGDGPLHVLSLADVTDRTPVASAFIEASRELGFPMTPDLGGAIPTGVGWNQLSIRGHRRDDAATAYLGRLDGAAVDLLPGTQVLGLVIERGRCTGLRLPGRLVRPEIEILLCAGAIDSPRLLMLSGIGPGEQLRALGIPVAQDLPEVGRHLEDHLLLAGVAYAARREVARSSRSRPCRTRFPSSPGAAIEPAGAETGYRRGRTGHAAAQRADRGRGGGVLSRYLAIRAGGFVGNRLGRLVNTADSVWSLGASASEALFEGGLRPAQVAAARATYDHAVATYPQTVLTAFQQVEDELAALRIYEQQAAAEAVAVASAQGAVAVVLNDDALQSEKRRRHEDPFQHSS